MSKSQRVINTLNTLHSDALRVLSEHEVARMLDASFEQPEALALRTLLANLDAMVYRSGATIYGSMQYVSAGCELVTGYAPEVLLGDGGHTFKTLIVAEDLAPACKHIETALARRQRFEVKYRVTHADGTQRWLCERGAGVYDTQGGVLAIDSIVQDVTYEQHAFLALREAERRYRSLFDNAIEGIFRTTPDGQYMDANPALARIYGYESPAELIDSLRNIRDQLYVDTSRREEFMRIINARGVISGFESQVYRRNRDVIWISENARAVCDAQGAVICYEGTVEDITERKLYEARIEQQANYDMLTKLANRSLLMDRLQQSIHAAANFGVRLAVVFIDLDRFKYINDSLGHQIGDDLLCEMARRLSECVREGDTVARLGGDEFVLLLKGLADADCVAAVVERVLAAVAEPWQSTLGVVAMTCSAGVALYPCDGADAQSLLKHADSAMYRAKERGRNNIQFFTAELNQTMTERLALEGGLRRALERQQFRLYYQPRIDAATGRIIGAEALMRWQVSDDQVISPARFIPVAEETGLIVPMGTWALQAACEQNLRWQAAGLPPIVISVNVSLRQFQRDNFPDVLAQVLATTGLSPALLEIEVTESLVMDNAERLIDMLCDIKLTGVQIAVDDFGTGYSSLSYLKRFPVNRLKIDRSFVQDIMLDSDGEAIVRTIIALGHNLGLRVVAEGVEHAAQVQYLKFNGCDELQGFYYGRPMPAAEFEQLLRNASAAEFAPEQKWA